MSSHPPSDIHPLSQPMHPYHLRLAAPSSSGEGQSDTCLLYNPHDVKHRQRTTPKQLKRLEEVYKTDTTPNNVVRRTLAAELDMSPRRVQVWFQNRRAKIKERQKKNERLARNATVIPSTNSSNLPTDGSQTSSGEGSSEETVPPSLPEYHVVPFPRAATWEASGNDVALPADSGGPYLQPYAPPTDVDPYGRKNSLPVRVLPHPLAPVPEPSPNRGPPPPSRVPFTPAQRMENNAMFARRKSLPAAHLRLSSHPYSSAGMASMLGAPQLPPMPARLQISSGGLQPSRGLDRGSTKPRPSRPFSSLTTRIPSPKVVSRCLPPSHQESMADYHDLVAAHPHILASRHSISAISTSYASPSVSPRPSGMGGELVSRHSLSNISTAYATPSPASNAPTLYPSPPSLDMIYAPPPAPPPLSELFSQRQHEPYGIPSRPMSHTIPGPLPDVGYSFGRQSAAPLAAVSDVAAEVGTPLPSPLTSAYDQDFYGAMPHMPESRFGSFASVVSTATSISACTDAFDTGAYGQDVVFEANINSGPNTHTGGFDGQMPQGFTPDMRRASCPALLLNSFSTLDVHENEASRNMGGASRSPIRPSFTSGHLYSAGCHPLPHQQQQANTFADRAPFPPVHEETPGPYTPFYPSPANEDHVPRDNRPGVSPSNYSPYDVETCSPMDGSPDSCTSEHSYGSVLQYNAQPPASYLAPIASSSTSSLAGAFCISNS